MPKISELTVADLRGFEETVSRHVVDRMGFKRIEWCQFTTGRELRFSLRVNDSGEPYAKEHSSLHEQMPLDADWHEFATKIWRRIEQFNSRDARDLQRTMTALGGAIEALADSPSEFAIDLCARLKQCRDDAGARLIAHQAAE